MQTVVYDHKMFDFAARVEQVDNGADFRSAWFAGNAWNEQHKKFGKKEKDAVSCITGDLGMAIQFTEPYHGQSKNIERLFGFVSGEFDKTFDSYRGSNTAGRPDGTRVYLGSFEGAPARPLEELPTKEEVRALFDRLGTTRRGNIQGRAWMGAARG
jgi:hypothetical protein